MKLLYVLPVVEITLVYIITKFNKVCASNEWAVCKYTSLKLLRKNELYMEWESSLSGQAK